MSKSFDVKDIVFDKNQEDIFSEIDTKDIIRNGLNNTLENFTSLEISTIQENSESFELNTRPGT